MSSRRKNNRLKEAEIGLLFDAMKPLYDSFNDFLFNDGEGDFKYFDHQYRILAKKHCKYTSPNPDYFTNYALR